MNPKRNFKINKYFLDNTESLAFYDRYYFYSFHSSTICECNLISVLVRKTEMTSNAFDVHIKIKNLKANKIVRKEST